MSFPRRIKTGRCRRCVGAQRDVRHSQDRIVVTWRLDFKHVEPGMGDPPFLKGFDQSSLLDSWTTSRIDEDRGLLHLPKMLLHQHAFGFGRGGSMHRYEVRL